MQLATPDTSVPLQPIAPAGPSAADAESAALQADSPIAPHLAPSPDPADPMAQPSNPGLRIVTHVNARGLALGVLATIAFVWALQWSKAFLVPLLLGIFLSYTLNPLVVWLERIRIKRAIGATLVTVVILVILAGVANRIQDEFINIIDDLPRITQKVTKILTKTGDGQPGTIAQVQAAATQIEQATSAVGGNTRKPSRKEQSNASEGSSIRVMDWVLAGSVSLISFATQATMVIFLVFFLLLAGDTFKRKMVKLTGPSLTKKKVTVHILDDINTSIQNYMFMLLVTNTLLALMMWAALRSLGLENAGAWAVFAGLMHIIPYFGPLLITVATGLVAFMQFESVRMVVLVAGSSLAIATLVGTVIATWMTGRIAKMNPTAVFVSLLFWGWLWGMWGMLLGVPVVVIMKVVAERVEGMEVLAELLGD